MNRLGRSESSSLVWDLLAGSSELHNTTQTRFVGLLGNRIINRSTQN